MQPALILMYLVIVKEVNKNLIILLIIFNFFNWALNFQILDINYKDNSVCGPKEAISADLDIKLIDGSVKNFLSSRQMIACWVNDTERGKRILEGKSTRISK